MNLTSLNIVLRCAKDDDTCTLKVADKPDILNLVYEAKSESVIVFLCWVDYYLFSCLFVILDCSVIRCSRNIYIDSDCIVGYDMKLLDIDSDTLGIPEPNTNHVLLCRPADLLASYLISHN